MDDKTPLHPQTVEDFEKMYLNRPVFTGRRSASQQHLDKYENINTTPQIHQPPPAKIKFIDGNELLLKIKEALEVYKRVHHIKKIFIHEDNIEIIKNMVRWAVGDTTGPLDVNKGLYIYGKHGSGKTDFVLTFTNTINVLARTYDNLVKFKPHSYNAIFETIRSGNLNIFSGHQHHNIFLDDFLYQDRNQALVYGNSDNVADIVITRLDDLHKAGYQHIFTSNLPPDQITEQDLHPGSLDRLNGMINSIYWSGESLRQAKQ